MGKRIVAGTVLASMCLLLVAASAAAGEKAHVIRICTPEDAKKEYKVVIEGESDRAWLGVGIQDLDAEKRKAMDLDKGAGGVLVNEVYEESPAEAAGLKDGDVIVGLAGKKTTDVKHLIDVMGHLDPGNEVEVTVLRDGKEQMLIAVLSSRPEEMWVESSGPFMSGLKGLEGLAMLGDLALPWIEIGLSGGGGRGRLGVYIDDLSSGLAEYFEVPDGKGVLVEDVVDDSPAEKADIRAGDIIIKVGETRVGDRGGLIEAIAEMEADVETPIVVVRKGKELTLSAVVGESEYDKAIKEYEKAIKIHSDELGRARSKAMIIESKEVADDLEEELEELRQELQELKKELRELKKD
ncbi:MAG: PDZ domain-containing protein [Candidatus Eisenbacteria bacterium]